MDLNARERAIAAHIDAIKASPKLIFQNCWHDVMPPPDHAPRNPNRWDMKMKWRACSMCPEEGHGVWSDLTKGYANFSQHSKGTHARDIDNFIRQAFERKESAPKGQTNMHQFIDHKSGNLFKWLDFFAAKPQLPLSLVECPEFLKVW
jgi:hypothetical protein